MASFDEAIPPGKAGKISGTMHTTNIRGIVTKAISVVTNDPNARSTTLTLKGRVVGSVELLPIPQVAVTDAGPDSRPGRLIVRKDPTEKGDLAVKNVTASLPWLRVSTRKAGEAEPAIEGLPETRKDDVIVEIRADGPALTPGSFQATLVFDTGLEREPQVTVPIYAYVRPPITLGAEEVLLQPGVDGLVLVALRSDVDMEKLTATAEPAGLKAGLERANATTLRLKVSLDAAAGPPPETGTVTLVAGAATATVRVRVLR